MCRSFRLFWLVLGLLPGWLLGQADSAKEGSEGRSSIVRPLSVLQTRYRLRSGEPAKIDAPPETLDFLLKAKHLTVTIGGADGRGLVLGPSMRGGDILLGASLTMKAGEYAVTLSAVGESGEERATVANVTVEALPPVPTGGSTPPVVLLNGWQFSVLPPSSCPISTTGPAETFGTQIGRAHV